MKNNFHSLHWNFFVSECKEEKINKNGMIDKIINNPLDHCPLVKTGADWPSPTTFRCKLPITTYVHQSKMPSFIQRYRPIRKTPSLNQHRLSTLEGKIYAENGTACIRSAEIISCFGHSTVACVARGGAIFSRFDYILEHFGCSNHSDICFCNRHLVLMFYTRISPVWSN